MYKKRNAQVTLFIIVAIIIVSGIIMFFVFREGVDSDGGFLKETNENSFLDACLEEKITEIISTISLQGGNIEHKEGPKYLNFKFGNEPSRDISYLCYTGLYYEPCINQQPLLIQHLKKEIKNYSANYVESCFSNLTRSLEKDGYNVDSNYNGFEVKLESKKVILEIDADISKSKADESSKVSNFKIIIPTKFYDLAIVSQEIISQEAEYCNFNYIGFMAFYNEYKITRVNTVNESRVYSVEHRASKEKFRFVIRGCAAGPGL